MRLQRASPLLLLLAPSLIAAAAADTDGSGSARALVDSSQNVKKDTSNPAGGAAAAAAAPRNPVAKPYRGTEDAPVDGLDGKPKQGPFVDTKPDQTKVNQDSPATTTTTSKSRPTSLDKFGNAQVGANDETWRPQDIPEKNDGVMNDANRVSPKKGTTGTEGGITEKDKERRLKTNLENKPQAPNEAPPLPHSEQKLVEAAEQGRAGEKTSQKSTSKDTEKSGDASKRKSSEAGSGGIGLEKPNDLPDTPHDIPHPDPKTPSTNPNLHKEITDSKDDKDGGAWLKNTMPYTEGKPRPAPKSTTSSGQSGDSTGVDEDEDSWHEWIHSFGLSFTMILFSEIGDKTFLVAALMAMRHSQILVFSAALGALGVMTVLSAVLGHAVPALLPQRFTTFAAALLFLVFGTRMLREGLAMPRDSGIGEEMKEVEAELEEQEHSMALDRSRNRSAVSPYSLEAGRGRTGSRDEKHDFPRGEPSPPVSRSPTPRHGRPAARRRFAGLLNLCSLVLSPAWVQTFVMTFLGEWGDRSQIATIAMAAGQDYWWVTLGAITGHACCTGLAVLGGRALAGRVSMRVVTIGGAIAFLVFGVIYLFECLVES